MFTLAIPQSLPKLDRNFSAFWILSVNIELDKPYLTLLLNLIASSISLNGIMYKIGQKFSSATISILVFALIIVSSTKKPAFAIFLPPVKILPPSIVA